MKTRLVSALLLATTAASPVLAQDVVMRRPLPGAKTVASTPDGVEPTPAPTGGPSTPEPSPTSPTPAEDAKYPVYVAVGWCGLMETGKLYAFCAQSDEDGTLSVATDNGLCASQSASNPAYATAAQTLGEFYTVIPPSQALTANGTDCVLTQKTYASMCSGDAPSCHEITYVYETVGGISRARYVSSKPAAAASCTSSYNSVGEEVADMIVKAGMVPAGPKGMGECTPPDIYAANGVCTMQTTGNTDGSTTISYRFVENCYAVRDLDTVYGTFSLSPASNSQCASAANTDAEKEIIARYLGPNLKDPSALVRNCYLGGGVALNYQRDTEYDQSRVVDERVHLATYENSDRWPDGISDYEIRRIAFTYPYVCTDIDRGYGSRPGYYANANDQGSTYDPERYPCNVEREVDKERLRREVEDAAGWCRYYADQDDRADGRPLTGRNACLAPEIADDGSTLTVTKYAYRDMHW